MSTPAAENQGNEKTEQIADAKEIQALVNEEQSAIEARQEQASPAAAETPTAENPAGDPQQQEAQTVSAEDAVEGTINLAGLIADSFGYKSLSSVLQDARWAEISPLTVKVLQKTAFGQRILRFLQIGLTYDEIQLAMALKPMWDLMKTAFHNDVEALRKAAQEKQQQAQQTA